MKKTTTFFIVLFISLTTFYNGFSSNKVGQSNSDPTDEFEILNKYLEANSNFILNDAFPILNADEVKKNLNNPKYHIIDIRSESWFEYGHIKGAVNLEAENLLNYFESKINPQDFEKIILVCYSGQSASYFSGLLRIAGYDNVYSMKWGMSSWREDFAENAWLKNISSSYDSKITTVEDPKPEIGNHPKLNTGKTEAQDILKARLTELFKLPYKDYIIKPEEVFENSNDYFIANFTKKENFDSGHIAGAIDYIPGASLSSTLDLFTLPIDKKIVVYDETGLKTAYVVAYLNVLGYNVGNLAYGANGFMNDKLKRQNMEAFTKKEINMYPVIE